MHNTGQAWFSLGPPLLRKMTIEVLDDFLYFQELLEELPSSLWGATCKKKKNQQHKQTIKKPLSENPHPVGCRSSICWFSDVSSKLYVGDVRPPSTNAVLTLPKGTIFTLALTVTVPCFVQKSDSNVSHVHPRDLFTELIPCLPPFIPLAPEPR